MANFKTISHILNPILFFVIIFFASCTKNSQEKLLHDSCIYKYDALGSTITWTAYKFTSKVGVSGNLEQFKITPSQQDCHNIDDVLRGAKIQLTATTLYGDTAQQSITLRNMFFGKLKSNIVTGEVLTVNSEKKSAEISLTFNNVTRTMLCDYTTSKTRIEIMTTLNLEDFNAENCIDSLQTACGEYHKGDDGIMMTWLDVDVKVAANLKRYCN